MFIILKNRLIKVIPTKVGIQRDRFPIKTFGNDNAFIVTMLLLALTVMLISSSAFSDIVTELGQNTPSGRFVSTEETVPVLQVRLTSVKTDGYLNSMRIKCNTDGAYTTREIVGTQLWIDENANGALDKMDVPLSLNYNYFNQQGYVTFKDFINQCRVPNMKEKYLLVIFNLMTPKPKAFYSVSIEDPKNDLTAGDDKKVKIDCGGKQITGEKFIVSSGVLTLKKGVNNPKSKELKSGAENEVLQVECSFSGNENVTLSSLILMTDADIKDGNAVCTLWHDNGDGILNEGIFGDRKIATNAVGGVENAQHSPKMATDINKPSRNEIKYEKINCQINGKKEKTYLLLTLKTGGQKEDASVKLQINPKDIKAITNDTKIVPDINTEGAVSSSVFYIKSNKKTDSAKSVE